MGGFSERLIDQMNNEAQESLDSNEALKHRLHIARVSLQTDEAVMDGMEALIDLLTTRNVELELDLLKLGQKYRNEVKK